METTTIIGLVLVLLLVLIASIPGMASAYFEPAADFRAPAFVLHYTPWCGYCTRIKPVWRHVARENPHLRFLEINEDVAKTPTVSSYPTIIARATGARYAGPADVPALRAWVAANTPRGRPISANLI
jgi:thiol-disulfide isomerase/thioredoxin